MKIHRTLEQIRRDGLTALRTRLGREGMVRFLQQFEHGSGDYVADRQPWLQQASLTEIRHLAGVRGGKKRSVAT